MNIRSEIISVSNYVNISHDDIAHNIPIVTHRYQEKFIECTSNTNTFLRGKCARRYYVNIVMGTSDKIIGHAVYSLYVHADSNILLCSIDLFLINIDWQGKGLSKFAFASLIKNIMTTNKQIKSIILEVHCDNSPAIHVYRRAGFSSFGQRNDFILMRKNINTVFTNEYM